MIIFSIIYALFILYIITSTLKELSVRIDKGQYILKLRKYKKGSLIFTLASLPFFIYFLISHVSNYLIYDNEGDLTLIVTPLIMTFMCFSYIAKAVNYCEIIEKGIYFDRGFYDWSKIYCYKWISFDTINFKATS